MNETLASTHVEVDYDIPRREYASFISKLRTTLAQHRPNKPPIPDVVEGHPVLATQTPIITEPNRWIDCKLLAVDEHKKPTVATLALRGDNVYLIGFRAQSQQWYEFGFKNRSVRLVDPHSIFLECDVAYRDLLGVPKGVSVKPALMALQLGKSFAEEGVNRLSGYVQEAEGGKADADTKLALARMAVMFCESARIDPIYATVNKGWAGHGNLTDIQVEYLWRWGDMSQALLGWSIYNWIPEELAKKLDEINIRNKDDALGVVNLILNKRPEKPKSKLVVDDADSTEEDEALGQALLEVFSVRADFPVMGIIAVFDGMRGQIIYNHNHSSTRSPATKQVDELVLTGPYRAVSAADGNCTIKVLDTDYAGPGGDAGGTLRCLDCYSDAVYDAPLTRAISTDLGPVEVTYALLRNAVEATVQVKLLAHAAATHVYGKVTARSGAFPGVGSMLFSRDAGDKVAVVVATDGCTVPLARTVVAAPLGSPFVVVVSFHTSEDNVVHGELEFDPDLSGEHVKLIHGEQGHGAVEVKVSWWSEI